MLSLGAAKVLGILLESLVYGVFLSMFGYNMYLHTRSLSGREANNPNVFMRVASTVLFVIITIRWIIEVSRLYEAVVVLEGQISLTAYFLDLTRKKQIAVTLIFGLEVMLADFILLYRLYHVWKPHWWICILPALGWVGVSIANSLSVWSMSHAHLEAGIFQRNVKRWVTLFFASTIPNNIYCTTAITIRLLRSHHSLAHRNTKSYAWRVLRIFVESAALLTILMFVTFCTFLAGQNIQYTLLDVTSPVLGISFILILLRLNSDEAGSVVVSGNHVASQRGAQSIYPLQSINVNVSQHTEVDSDVEGKTAAKGPYGDIV